MSNGITTIVPHPALVRLREENRELRDALNRLSADHRAMQDEINLVKEIIAPVYDAWRKAMGRNDTDPPWFEVLDWLVAVQTGAPIDG